MRRESTTALPPLKTTTNIISSSNNNDVNNSSSSGSVVSNISTTASGNQVSRKDLSSAAASSSAFHLFGKSSGKTNDVSSCRCAVPMTCSVGQEIQMTDLHDCVKIICNNDACPVGRFMHRECFESWEETVLSYLRSTGRARSWSEKQRLQNLWTKKGYDLTYKACGCKCGKGHLRKDLDWIPPPSSPVTDHESGAAAGGVASGKKKKKNRRKSKPDRPSLVILSNNSYHNSSSNSNNNNPVNNTNGPNASNFGIASNSSGTTTALSRRNSSSTSNSTFNNNSNNNSTGPGFPPRDRTSSLSSTGSGGTSNGGSSPPIFAADFTRSPDLQVSSVKKLFFGGSDRNRAHPGQYQQLSQAHSLLFRERSNSGTMFGRRPDYSTFNILPRTKINSYHIRMEDETSHGNDDIRTLILSTLSAHGMNRVHCIICSNGMPIFERFPLIDGTFFLSPRQHSKAAVQIIGASIERKFLNAVCMGCLEGWNSSLRCRSCQSKWDGSHLILGSMYSYDIFAAVPCCMARLKCCNCNNLAISAGRRLEFFSDYSQSLSCNQCGVKDFHFVKPLYITFMTSNAPGAHLVMKSSSG